MKRITVSIVVNVGDTWTPGNLAEKMLSQFEDFILPLGCTVHSASFEATEEPKQKVEL